MLFLGLSGPIASGKTTLSEVLEETLGSLTISVSLVVRDLAKSHSRSDLAQVAQELASRAGESWLYNYAVQNLSADEKSVVVVDAIRRTQELDGLRTSPVQLVHVFLNAPLDVLSKRYSGRGRDSASYLASARHPSELALGPLADLADLYLDSSILSPQQEAAEIIDLVRIRHPECELEI